MNGRAYIFTSSAIGKGSMMGGISGRAATFGMKVTVMVTQLATDKRLLVTQNDHIVRTASGNIVRLPNN